jgi:diaminohydroxyphosphoribosylaminopyrimidine deaminase/5-amino-6-(5-phosphoribosylamino)uracil reductase
MQNYNDIAEIRKEIYMRRALELAANGAAYASPNPMVGAVIVAPDGRVIGEGWHRRCGEGHAEVNAVASVAKADIPLLGKSTMFVTLEPCSHYGKTPPCARMIVEREIPRVVVAMADPNPKVSGRGIGILRDAGVGVEVGLLADEAYELNRRFLKSVTSGRSFITLKWARSKDGYMDWVRSDEHPEACRFSTPLTSLSTMRLRALHDAVITTAATVQADNPRLTLRNFDGKQPVAVVLTHSKQLPEDSFLAKKLLAGASDAPMVYEFENPDALQEIFHDLYTRHGISSVLVEAGPTMLSTLIDMQLWDDAREEIAPFALRGEGRHSAPVLPAACIHREECVGDSILRYYRSDGSDDTLLPVTGRIEKVCEKYEKNI